MLRHLRAIGLVSTALVAIGGCQAQLSAPADLTEATAAASIVPPGGSTAVDRNAPIVITFTRPMQAGMEMYMALHEGDVTGPEVRGTRTWSDDRRRLTFAPAEPLKPQTRYTLHLGGGMRDADGGLVTLAPCATRDGGRWATGQMMSGRMMGERDMMGPGWRHPDDGTYGMVFPFTTA
jgi:hypothetical protein